jgi:predicted PurR-regulated permease PerM/GNAT superfamily N-acetyltransferase
MDISPRWSATTKLIVMLAILAVVGFFFNRFQVLITPLIMALILAYLLNPIVTALTKYLRLSRTIAVLIVYAVLILLLFGLAGGVGLLLQQQFSGVLATALTFINSIPVWIDSLSAKPLSLGPFTFDLSTADVTLLQNALLPMARDWIGNVTQWMTGAASGVASFLAWTMFTYIVSFYLIHDMFALEKGLLGTVPEDYKQDAERLLSELGPIWNAFLRGQLMLSLIMGTAVGVVMSILGLRYALILALLAGVMEFLPLIGPYLAAGTAIVIALFQPTNWLGLSPQAYAIVVAAAALTLQQLEANVFSVRIIGHHLKIHPVILIIGALIGVTLLGIPGLLLSGPIIATARLFGKYIHAKLFNLPPWPDLEEKRPLAAKETSVLIRPAWESDKGDMLDLTALMWEGHDYIPQVWSEWLADHEGILVAAELDSRMVGFGKLTRLGPQEWWMEGLRVHPEFQGLKIGSQISEYLITQWKQREGGVIRLATSSERIQIHHLCDRLGFRRVGRCWVTAAPSVEGGDCAFQPLTGADAEEVLALSEKITAAWGTPGLVNNSWRWSKFTEDQIIGFIRRQRAWWWQGRSCVLLAYDSDHDGQPDLEVAAVLAPLEKLAPMLRQLRVLAGRQKVDRVAWVLPDHPRVQEAAKRAGFVPQWNAQLWIFERSDPPATQSLKGTEV